jgi:hypothetical protein
VFHKPGDTITDNSSPNQVKLPFGMNLSNLVTRISYLEQHGSSLAIAGIKAANPLLGINEYYTLEQNESIPFAKDEKFFQYYRRDRGYSSIDFGVVIQAYTDNAALNLFEINKGDNQINIGNFKENAFRSSTVIGGDLTNKNDSGITLITNGNETKLTPYSNYLSCQSGYNPSYTTDSILSKGLRTSVTDNEVVFHKPGDTITDNSSPNQVKVPFGTDLTNIGTDLTNLETRLTTLESGSGSKNLITFR